MTKKESQEFAKKYTSIIKWFREQNKNWPSITAKQANALTKVDWVGPNEAELANREYRRIQVLIEEAAYYEHKSQIEVGMRFGFVPSIYNNVAAMLREDGFKVITPEHNKFCMLIVWDEE